MPRLEANIDKKKVSYNKRKLFLLCKAMKEEVEKHYYFPTNNQTYNFDFKKMFT